MTEVVDRRIFIFERRRDYSWKQMLDCRVDLVLELCKSSWAVEGNFKLPRLHLLTLARQVHHQQEFATIHCPPSDEASCM
jgi:hypothetical protein